MASRALAPSHASPLDGVGSRLAHRITGERVEVVAFAYCDSAGRVLGMRYARSILSDMIALPVRRIAIDALAFDCEVVVMAHNHPRGDAWPSRADRETTQRVAVALGGLGVRLFDHIVVGGTTRWSFRAAGLL